MTDDAVESMARHLHRQHAKTTYGLGENWQAISSDRRSYWRHLARSALQAVGKRPRISLRVFSRNPP
jgi:hypothetical protein